ncbi:crosslink repair DNA glycosylase YcaQ family protein [Micromonospora sp. NPDC006766]|uniref:DNA glycosylase AlkZ-like family protein n=1 Tax=Micromonospora sp. NPDC006766 TaxID=3154778 RepID=UPI0034117EE4
MVARRQQADAQRLFHLLHQLHVGVHLRPAVQHKLDHAGRSSLLSYVSRIIGQGGREGSQCQGPSRRVARPGDRRAGTSRRAWATQSVAGRTLASVVMVVDRAQVLSFRIRAQQLDRTEGMLADTALLDIGAQDTGTSPPVLQPIAGFRPAAQVSARFDLIRAYLRLLGPATPKHVADYLDAPVKDVKARWPADAVEVSVAGEARWVLSADADRFDAPRPQLVRLLGPFDLFLQAKDRPLLVDDPARAKVLWPVLGRPGAVVADGEIAGTWRPRQSGGKLTVQVQLWPAPPARLRAAIGEQAERLAAHRQVRLVKAGFVD